MLKISLSIGMLEGKIKEYTYYYKNILPLRESTYNAFKAYSIFISNS